MTVILETTRLILRELTTDDLDPVAAMLTDPEVMRFWPRPYTLDESAEWIDRQRAWYAEFGHGYWLAVEKSSGTAIGQVGLLPRLFDGANEVDVGYIIHRPHWRKGFATEGASACRDHAFDALKRPRVLCLVRPENTPSLGVARKIGLRTDGRIIQNAGLDHLVFVGEPRFFIKDI